MIKHLSIYKEKKLDYYKLVVIFFLNSLNEVKYENIIFSNDGKTVTVKDKSGKLQTLEILPASASLFHNIKMDENNKLYINNDPSTRNIKYTNKAGYELVINKSDKKVITDPITRGTFNQDNGTGPFDGGFDHLDSDVRLYVKYGSGINDKTLLELRNRINKCTNGMIGLMNSFVKSNFNFIWKERINCE